MSSPKKNPGGGICRPNRLRPGLVSAGLRPASGPSAWAFPAPRRDVPSRPDARPAGDPPWVAAEEAWRPPLQLSWGERSTAPTWALGGLSPELVSGLCHPRCRSLKEEDVPSCWLLGGQSPPRHEPSLRSRAELSHYEWRLEVTQSRKRRRSFRLLLAVTWCRTKKKATALVVRHLLLAAGGSARRTRGPSDCRQNRTKGSGRDWQKAQDFGRPQWLFLRNFNFLGFFSERPDFIISNIFSIFSILGERPHIAVRSIDWVVATKAQ